MCFQSFFYIYTVNPVNTVFPVNVKYGIYGKYGNYDSYVREVAQLKINNLTHKQYFLRTSHGHSRGHLPKVRGKCFQNIFSLKINAHSLICNMAGMAEVAETLPSFRHFRHFTHIYFLPFPLYVVFLTNV